MNYKIMIRIQAWVLLIEAVFMLPALIIAICESDMAAVTGFLVAIAVALAAAGVMAFYTRNAKKKFYAREGLVCTGVAWVVLSIVGAIPFTVAGRIPNYMDSFFEIVSGFTTTGASVLSDVEMLGHALLYWRSFSHWVGGMGVLVFFLAVIPASGRNDGGYMLHILRAESPGPSVNKMVPKMRSTAILLYKMYCALTMADIILLFLVGKMPLFDAICIAFGTAGTGGFAVLNSGCASYSPAAQNITTVFMLLFGVNFSIYYLIIMKRLKEVLGDEELKMYLGIVFLCIIVICIDIIGDTPETMSFRGSLHHAAFQVASIVTTTGFSTVDFDLWPSLSKAILLCLMFMGASAGSTGGGIKVSRLLLLNKNVRRNMHQIFHPNEVRVIRMNGSRVPEQTIYNVDSYLAAYVLIVVISFLAISADSTNFSITTNFSAIMATFNNIGPGFDAVGATQNYGAYSNLSKLVMALDMLAGRLEIFPVLALLLPGTYYQG